VQAVYYRDADGHEPVNDFIDGLLPERQEEIDHTIALLNRLGPSDPLPFPYSSQVDGQLREPLPLRPRAVPRAVQAVAEPVRTAPRHREALGRDPASRHRDRQRPMG
jgi:hypothetical protein